MVLGFRKLGPMAAALALSLAAEGAAAAVECEVIFRVDDAAQIGSLQFEADYAASGGEIVGTGEDAVCVARVSALAGTFDIDAESLLAAGLLTPAGFTTPADVLSCSYSVASEPVAGVTVRVVDASTPANVAIVPPPAMSARVVCPVASTTTTTTTTTTTVALDVCGKPCAGAQGEPQASDALFMLRAALELAACPDCVCDVDRSGDVSATDALRVLARAIGTGPVLECVACAEPFVPGCS